MSNTIQKNREYKKYVVDSKLQYFKPHATKIEKTFAEEVSSSLNADLKFISPKYFYDKKGSELFEKICLLPEYYPTRTEVTILKKLQQELLSFLDDTFRIVELGSGSSVKTRLIIDVFAKLQNKIEYFPIDISEILTESSEQLIHDYDDKKNLITFLGSSFGNFSPSDGYLFLKKIHSTMKSGDLFLIGLDLVKEKQILESAYDDSQGVTAEFNINVLSRINDELGANFNLENFEHHSVYHEKEQRIEMYLKSSQKQSVIIPKSDLLWNLEKNELIHTEYSHKYWLSQIHDLLDDAGFELKHTWLDENKYFSLTLLAKK